MKNKLFDPSTKKKAFTFTTVIPVCYYVKQQIHGKRRFEDRGLTSTGYQIKGTFPVYFSSGKLRSKAHSLISFLKSVVQKYLYLTLSLWRFDRLPWQNAVLGTSPSSMWHNSVSIINLMRQFNRVIQESGKLPGKVQSHIKPD